MEGLLPILIPVAIVLVVRFFLSRKSHDEETGEAEPYREEEAEEEFDAYALVPDEDEDEQPLPAEKPAARQSFAWKIKEEEEGTIPVQAAAAGDGAETLSTRSTATAIPQAQSVTQIAAKKVAAAEKADARFVAKLERLSPLRRAVVMAEVLGPPKSLQ